MAVIINYISISLELSENQNIIYYVISDSSTVQSTWQAIICWSSQETFHFMWNWNTINYHYMRNFKISLKAKAPLKNIMFFYCAIN